MNTSVNSTVTVHVGEDRTVNNVYRRESSEPRWYRNDGLYDNNTYVSYYTAVISLSNGKFSDNDTFSIVWEDSCSSDGACLIDITAPCVRKQDCGLTTVTQNTNTTTGTTQDVRIYLAWQGSAKANVALKSASYMPSRFRAYSFASYYKKLFDLLPKKK
jgi:hypothetical protein